MLVLTVSIVFHSFVSSNAIIMENQWIWEKSCLKELWLLPGWLKYELLILLHELMLLWEAGQTYTSCKLEKKCYLCQGIAQVIEHRTWFYGHLSVGWLSITCSPLDEMFNHGPICLTPSTCRVLPRTRHWGIGAKKLQMAPKKYVQGATRHIEIQAMHCRYDDCFEHFMDHNGNSDWL